MIATIQASVTTSTEPQQKSHCTLRFVTAASLFDGHDAAINIIRRLLQANGAEVIHLGHNRSVEEIITAALQEDAHAIAISSYQGGHVEFFKYAIDLLKQRGGGHIKVFGGGGGVITPDEIEELQTYGVEKIYTPEDGQRMGLKGIIEDMFLRAAQDLCQTLPADLSGMMNGSQCDLARVISALEQNVLPFALRQQLNERIQDYQHIPVIGVTGTGGAGKSSLTDEIIRRFRLDHDEISIAVIALDPTKRKTGGALLGDRIRMNALGSSIYLRSMATRGSEIEVSPVLADVVAVCKLAGFALVIVETPGIGQGDAAIVSYVDYSLYVMTPEFGAASQLEKIDMIDYADIIAINKFDRKGALDALRDVRKQKQRSHEAFSQSPENMPVFGTIAAKFNDEGVSALYQYLLHLFNEKSQGKWHTQTASLTSKVTDVKTTIIPPERTRYLAEITTTVHKYKQQVTEQVKIARERQQLSAAKEMLHARQKSLNELDQLIQEREEQLDSQNKKLLASWSQLQTRYSADEYIFNIRDKDVRTKLYVQSLSGTRISKVALPRYEDHGEQLRWLLLENVPGRFPFTAGVFPFKREGEDPGRMFAGEGDPFRTNRRFKFLSEHLDAKRLSTAFDSVTLYGFDPEERPDIYGKIGNSGVSIATLDDMKVLYDGFDLTDPITSVSMTINGPAPTILAMFLNTAIDQRIEKFTNENKRAPTADEKATIRAYVLENVRGTVQADILKEDQGQNTCIFSTEFSLKMMADIQEYFVQNKVRNFYSVSISGYHIAEAGANPITQLALTLSNAFTYVEAYLARGMHIDEFAPNLSFFFSNGMDPEYAVLGRVARRIWAIVLREKYGANERSQKLKYHVQTSGRSLHAQEMTFNDIRTTLEALIALYDNCNSLHTNAYDEALTTPTAESVRRAVAIQLIINKEWGLSKNENPNQGAFIIEELTELVEEAVLAEFNRINDRGGVLGAMETGYQRAKIQEESMLYEVKKHDGSLPIIGVNTYLNNESTTEPKIVTLARSSEEEKQGQISRLREFQKRHQQAVPEMLEKLQESARKNANVFAVLMEAVQVCSLGQITHALFEVGGQYRRSM
jgi:methylmalonyl-CoA mutase